MILNFSFNKIYNAYKSINEKQINRIEEMKKMENTIKNKTEVKKYQITKEKNDTIWQIEIPIIGVKATISERTTQDVMLEYVGHFEETAKWKGNVGLAAHNRGYPINYFARLKELKQGDEIIYHTKYGTRKYKVNLTTIIKDTDWSYLQKTQENKITLITCVENQPSKRRCIQGIEFKEE